MPIYDYNCPNCGHVEQYSPVSTCEEQKRCSTCGADLEWIRFPKPRNGEYRPFEPYFDEGLGVMVTGREHRRRVMRDQQCDFRDHPSPGQISARKDWANQQRKERARR